MDRLIDGPRSRAVVCHGNPLVGEDLRQLLLSEGAGEVLVIRSLDEVQIESDAIAFVEGSAKLLLQAVQIQGWLRRGTPVVAMNGCGGMASVPRGVHLLKQPFRSEDVQNLLTQVKVF
ncbi:hypothetical protein [Gymnodinialimonas ulvae]|uniref:hypothetical protein n=1 Tax=Gymnodinialimonas ulvae TaxID=3126504 RepID=UPI0030A47264